MTCLRSASRTVHIQALGAQGAVERLHMRVVGRLPRPGEVDLDAVVIRPQVHDLTDKLGTVIAEQHLWNSAPRIWFKQQLHRRPPASARLRWPGSLSKSNVLEKFWLQGQSNRYRPSNPRVGTALGSH